MQPEGAPTHVLVFNGVVQAKGARELRGWAAAAAPHRGKPPATGPSLMLVSSPSSIEAIGTSLLMVHFAAVATCAAVAAAFAPLPARAILQLATGWFKPVARRQTRPDSETRHGQALGPCPALAGGEGGGATASDSGLDAEHDLEFGVGVVRPPAGGLEAACKTQAAQCHGYEKPFQQGPQRSEQGCTNQGSAGGARTWYSSSPKSPMALDLSIQGFQTTASGKPDLVISTQLPAPSSTIWGV